MGNRPAQPDRPGLDDEYCRTLNELTHEPWQPAMDLCETPTAVVVILEVPGVAAADLQVTFQGHTLRVEGVKRGLGPPGGDGRVLCLERGCGPFSRLVECHRPVDAAGIRAELRDGILRVTLPMRQERRGQTWRIPVQEPDPGE